MKGCMPPEALAVLESHRGQIHLILTDLVMPGMGGRALSDRVAVLYPDVKVIYTSGYADDAVLERGPEAQSHFVAKPFSAAQLRQVVRDVLDG